MAFVRSPALSMDQPLYSSARLKLSNGAFCRPIHPHCLQQKRSLGIAHRADNRLPPYLALSSDFYTACRRFRFCVCEGINALHIGAAKGRPQGGGYGLRLLRQNSATVCLLECKNMLFDSIFPAGNRLRVSVVTSTNHEALASKFTAKIWRRDRDAQVTAFTEQSNSANEELLLFFFQLDLTTRLQRALNLNQYEVAQQLREKIVEVDKEFERLTEARLGSVSSKAEAQDKAIAILRLKNDLQQAVEAEDYNGAAELRDQISKLETESLAASARALAFQNVDYSFRLGQKVVHAKFGYRGVICGMDPLCSESESWSTSALVRDLPRGRNQPFYKVLVDMRAEPELLVAYVAEDNLIPPKEPDKDPVDHPYISFLFYGMDSGGDFIPIKQLRENYNQPRHELPWEEGENDSEGDGGNAKP